MTDFRKYLPLILLALAAVLVFSMCGSYNSAVSKDENVKKAWSQVENQYQRRADLIPNLVNTVKGYANFEQQTLQQVVQARASATQVKIDANNLTPEAIQRFEQAQQGLSGALSRLLAVTENYPDLKANQNFIELQKALETIEDNLQNSRRYYNGCVRDLNTSCETFPSVLIANAFGFEKRDFFELDNPEEAQNVKVSF